MLQSKTSARLLRVKPRRTQCEQMPSGLPLENGHSSIQSACLKRATSGLMHRSKQQCHRYVAARLARAFRLATSAGHRARLILPTGLLSGVELPVTSKYTASLASADNCEFSISESLATLWNGASASFHSTLAFSIQKLASRVLPQ